MRQWLGKHWKLSKKERIWLLTKPTPQHYDLRVYSASIIEETAVLGTCDKWYSGLNSIPQNSCLPGIS